MNIEPFIYAIDSKKRFKEYKRDVLLLKISLIILLLFIIGFSFFLKNWIGYYSEAKVDYGRLSEDDVIYAKDLIEQIRPEYLSTSRYIVFSTDITFIHKSNKYGKYPRMVGVNRITTKQIKIYLSGDEKYDLNTICHELLHSILLNKNDEFYVSDMAKQGVCFTKTQHLNSSMYT